jgi:hypothetical protein
VGDGGQTKRAGIKRRFVEEWMSNSCNRRTQIILDRMILLNE